MPDVLVPTVLDAILGATRRVVEVRRSTMPDAKLVQLAARHPPRPGAFADALVRGALPRVIAECKRRSPSRGVLRTAYDPAAIAAAYELNGAAAVSVLTESTFFDGEPEHLRAVRAAVQIPILRKDFIVDRYQLLEARWWGADAILLIAAALPEAELKGLLSECEHLGLDAVVEVHDREELARALAAGAAIVGVNNRNLKTLTVSTESAELLAAEIPDEVVAIAESGLRSSSDLTRLSAAGYDAFLVGERLMAADDPGRALKELRS